MHPARFPLGQLYLRSLRLRGGNGERRWRRGELPLQLGLLIWQLRKRGNGEGQGGELGLGGPGISFSLYSNVFISCRTLVPMLQHSVWNVIISFLQPSITRTTSKKSALGWSLQPARDVNDDRQTSISSEHLSRCLTITAQQRGKTENRSGREHVTSYHKVFYRLCVEHRKKLYDTMSRAICHF